MKTFKCQFGKDVSCEVNAPDQPPDNVSKYQPIVQWHGKASPRILRPYIAWMNSVNQTLSNEWKVNLMYGYVLTSNLVQMWMFKPGETPKMVTPKNIKD